MVKKKNTKNGGSKIPIQKTCKINVGRDSLDIDFFGANRQFGWIKVSLVHNKSDKHTSICDSYNTEIVSKNKTKKSVRFTNFTGTYSLTNKKI